METLSKRVVFYQDEDGTLEYEMYDGACLLHSTITNWNLSVFKKCLRVMNTLLHTMKMIGVEQVMAVTPNSEFAKLFGGRALSTLEYENKKYEVILWDLK